MNYRVFVAAYPHVRLMHDTLEVSLVNGTMTCRDPRVVNLRTSIFFSFKRLFFLSCDLVVVRNRIMMITLRGFPLYTDRFIMNRRCQSRLLRLRHTQREHSSVTRGTQHRLLGVGNVFLLVRALVPAVNLAGHLGRYLPLVWRDTLPRVRFGRRDNSANLNPLVFLCHIPVPLVKHHRRELFQKSNVILFACFRQLFKGVSILSDNLQEGGRFDQE